MASRKVILFIAMSLDGFIARPNDDLDWLNVVTKAGEDYGYSAFTQTVDTILLGRRTYEKVLSLVEKYPHNNKTTYVITRTTQPNQENIVFYTKSINNLICELKQQTGENIYCDGGAMLSQTLIREKLIDEMIISIIPILLGEGIRLFDNDSNIKHLKLKDTKHFDTGLVQLHYTFYNGS